jgi:uncharacterized protein (TIGR03083 family)
MSRGFLTQPDSIEVTSISPIGHAEAATLAATEFQRVIDLLRSLDPEDWTRPTACELWDVRAMAGHMLGMAEAQASVRQFLRDARASKSRDGSGTWIDGVTAHQVRERAHLTPAELVDRFAQVAPRAVRVRDLVPRPVRLSIRLKQDGVFDGERWTLGYLLDVLSTRDPWMHRLDICRATGRPVVTTAAHDGRLVADVVAEWARRHGQPFSLTLTGPAGGRWRSGTGGEHIQLDALDFCRTLSGRDRGHGLLAVAVPF